MSESLVITAAKGPAINPVLYEDAVCTLIKSAWRNSNENTAPNTQEARKQYFDDEPGVNQLVVVGYFDGEPVSALTGSIDQWTYPGMSGEYLGYLGKTALDISLFGVRVPYRGLGFGTQTLAAAAHVAHLDNCSLMSMNWADFQWQWFQDRVGFEGKYGLIAESVRGLPIPIEVNEELITVL
jgi:GNAT superfamily N-acetyltransferase